MTAPETKMQETKTHWEQVYATKQDSEVSWFEPLPQMSLDMLHVEDIAKDARILDVGGGSSRLAEALLDRGFTRITVLDIAAAALERSRKRLGERAGKVRWIVADITRWLPEEQYDAWHDRAVFHFLTDAQERAIYRERLASTVVPGGTVVLATFAPDGPERCSGLPVLRYSPEELAREMGSAFQLRQSCRLAHETPAKAVQHFQYSRFCRL